MVLERDIIGIFVKHALQNIRMCVGFKPISIPIASKEFIPWLYFINSDKVNMQSTSFRVSTDFKHTIGPVHSGRFVGVARVAGINVGGVGIQVGLVFVGALLEFRRNVNGECICCVRGIQFLE